jgi:hypothetical protein
MLAVYCAKSHRYAGKFTGALGVVFLGMSAAVSIQGYTIQIDSSK